LKDRRPPQTLATDTPDLPDARRLSTWELRAERDRLAQLRAECPPDRSRELRLATQRATEAEQARQQALKEHQGAAQEVGALQGRLLRRRDLQAARDRLVLADHALRTTTGQADQAAERAGCCGGRSSGAWAGWKPMTKRCAPRSARSPGSLAGAGGSTSGRWCWTRLMATGRTRPRPQRHAGTGGVAHSRRGAQRTHHRGDLGRRPTTADRERRADPSRLLGAEPRRDRPGRRRDWQVARAALEDLAGWGRHRDHRDQRPPNRERPRRTLGRDLGRQERDGR
jgi:hypothetical protein